MINNAQNFIIPDMRVPPPTITNNQNRRINNTSGSEYNVSKLKVNTANYKPTAGQQYDYITDLEYGIDREKDPTVENKSSKIALSPHILVMFSNVRIWSVQCKIY